MRRETYKIKLRFISRLAYKQKKKYIISVKIPAVFVSDKLNTIILFITIKTPDEVKINNLITESQSLNTIAILQEYRTLEETVGIT